MFMARAHAVVVVSHFTVASRPFFCTPFVLLAFNHFVSYFFAYISWNTGRVLKTVVPTEIIYIFIVFDIPVLLLLRTLLFVPDVSLLPAFSF